VRHALARWWFGRDGAGRAARRGKLVAQEEAKRTRHPLDRWDEITARAEKGQFPKGVDDFLTRYHGLFVVGPAQDVFMCRLRIPGGILSAHQLDGVADLAEECAGGYADVTTRANLQLREIPAAKGPEVVMRLGDLGLLPRGTGADNIRNITASPTAGIDAAELLDTRPLVRALHHHILHTRDLFALATLPDAGYDAMEPTRWPVPAEGPRTERFFAQGGTLNSRARLIPTPFRAPEAQPDTAFPLRLLTGRLRDQWHMMTRTGAVPRLMAHSPEPVLTLHPQDADGLEAGALVRAETPAGAGVFRLALDAGQRRGTGFAPMHWTSQFAPAARVNSALIAATDPVSGQPELKHTPLRVTPFAAARHGFLLTRARLEPDLAAWCAVVPLERGVWRHELAGEEPAVEALARLRDLLPAQDWALLEDPAAGVFRAAALTGGELQGVLALGPSQHLPPREWLGALMAGGPLAPEDRAALLVGRRADGPAPSPLICACHGVSAAAIQGCGAADVEGVGAATRAGTGCGSCKPEIAALLAKVEA